MDKKPKKSFAQIWNGTIQSMKMSAVVAKHEKAKLNIDPQTRRPIVNSNLAQEKHDKKIQELKTHDKYFGGKKLPPPEKP